MEKDYKEKRIPTESHIIFMILEQRDPSIVKNEARTYTGTERAPRDPQQTEIGRRRQTRRGRKLMPPEIMRWLVSEESRIIFIWSSITDR